MPNPLENILSKYLDKINEIDSNRGKVCDIILKTTGVKIIPKEVEITEHIIIFRAHPAKRQIIMFNKNDILFEIQKVEKIKNILDIK